VSDSIDAGEAYEKFLPEAQALPAEAVIPYRIDPDLALANIQSALPVIVARKDDIPAHLPKIDLEALLSLPELGLAVKHAATGVEQSVPSEKSAHHKLVEARTIRRTLLAVARGLAEAGLVPAHEVDDIMAGRGSRDIADDCIRLADLYQRHGEVLAGKHPIEPEKIREASEIGDWLIANLRTTSATPQEPTVKPAAVDARDRLATLLVRRYAELRKVAHYFHGELYEEVAPALQSRSVTRGRTGLTSMIPPA
jgi:hypothetical protein